MPNKAKKKQPTQTSEVVFLFGIVIQYNNLVCVIYYFKDCL